MGWATTHIARLKAGETIKFRPTGPSMSGIIESGELVTLRPITSSEELPIGSVVLCKCSGKEYLHLIKGANTSAKKGAMYLIGNNRGGTNGWTARKNIFGRLVSVES